GFIQRSRSLLRATATREPDWRVGLAPERVAAVARRSRREGRGVHRTFPGGRCAPAGLLVRLPGCADPYRILDSRRRPSASPRVVYARHRPRRVAYASAVSMTAHDPTG